MTTTEIRERLVAIIDEAMYCSDSAEACAAKMMAEFDVSERAAMIGPRFGDENTSACTCGHREFDHFGRRGQCLPIQTLVGRYCWCQRFEPAEPKET